MALFIGLAGQSPAAKWNTESNGNTPTPSSQLKRWNGAAFVAPTGSGEIAFGNALVADTGEDVFLINGGIGDTSLTSAASGANGFWSDLTALEPYDLFITEVTDALASEGIFSPSLDALIWMLGESEAAFGTDEQVFATALEDFISSQIRTDIVNLSGLSQLPVVIMGLGRNTGGNDVNWQAIRSSQKLASIPISTVSATSIDIPLIDGIHFTPDGYLTHGERGFIGYQFLFGNLSYSKGPEITKSTYNSDTQEAITILHSGGSSFLPTSGITGFEVSQANFIVNSTISASVKATETTIELTHSATGANNRVRYLYGADPDVSDVVYDNNDLPLEWLENTVSEGNTVADFIGLDPDLKGTVADQNMNSDTGRTAPLGSFFTAPAGKFVDVGHAFGRSANNAPPRPFNLALYECDANGNPDTESPVASVEIAITQRLDESSILETNTFTRFDLVEGTRYQAGCVGQSGEDVLIERTTDGTFGNYSVDATPTIVNDFVEPWNSNNVSNVGGMVIGFEVKNDGPGKPTIGIPYPDLINLDADVVSVDLRENIFGESSITVTWDPAIPNGLSETNGLVTGTVTTPTGTAIATVTGTNSFGSVTDSFQWTTLTTGDPTSGINVPINS